MIATKNIDGISFKNKILNNDDKRQTLSYNPFMNKKWQFYYSQEKNTYLQNIRGICFKDVELAIEDEGRVLDIIDHPNKAKYPDQKMYVLNINNYAYVVPFVKHSENKIFLKTIFPSRKLTKQYLTSKIRGNSYEQTNK